ncbi:MAG: hypothetical protein V9E96_06365 [Chitinophagaceae bacterium]
MILLQVYADMDFDTRNNYRSVIEELARHSNHSEEQVALAAVEFAARGRRKNRSAREAHVGFYLIDAGRATLEKQHPTTSLDLKSAYDMRAARISHRHIFGKHCRIFPILFVSGLLDLRNTFGRFADFNSMIAGVLGFGLAFEIPPSHLSTGM